LEGHLMALGSLGITADQMDVILFPMVESCLPDEILVAWQRSANYGREGRHEDPPRTEFDFMLEFVKKEVENEGQRTMVQSGFGVSFSKNSRDGYEVYKKRVSRDRDDVATAASLFNGQKEDCIFCNKSNHSSCLCYQAKKMSFSEKTKKIRNSGHCFKCLQKGHRAKDSRAAVNCRTCGNKHLVVMCPNQSSESQSVEPTMRNTTEGVQQSSASNGQSISMSNGSCGDVVLMKTLRVQVQGRNGKLRIVRLLFDEGSQRSYVKTSIAEELNCEVIEHLKTRNLLFGGILSEVKHRKGYSVEVASVHGNLRKKLSLVNEDVICNSCPTVPYGPWMKELTEKKIFITDTDAEIQEVEVLIGSDLWGSVMTGKMVKLKCGLVALESIFGWTLSGVIPNYKSIPNFVGVVISMMTCEEKSLPKLWELETYYGFC